MTDKIITGVIVVIGFLFVMSPWLDCAHEWLRKVHSENAYDEEQWDECEKCGKQKEI